MVRATARLVIRAILRRPGRTIAGVLGVSAAGCLYVGVAAALAPTPQAAPALGNYIVVAYNELGMHCMNQDFSELMILPPFNTLRAQVIRRGGSPEIMGSDVQVRFNIPGNTHSADKTNFWTFAPQLFGVAFPPDTGVTGTRLWGSMPKRAGLREFEATGIPLTPLDDMGLENPYQLATVTATMNGAVIAQTQAVVPVSWEISCNICHTTPGISVGRDILRKHDTRHGTQLESHMPVNCSSCHADPALGAPGQAGVATLSSAMHSSHASRMGPAATLASECYACHPGIRTNCQRDLHLESGMRCASCHGGMSDVGNPARTPWVSNPRCADCHQTRRPTFEFEPPGVLFKDATGHGGVKCVTCHSSPHAMTPAATATDNLQSNRLQGHAGVINTCTTCHTQTPSDPFPHRGDDD